MLGWPITNNLWRFRGCDAESILVLLDLLLRLRNWEKGWSSFWGKMAHFWCFIWGMRWTCWHFQAVHKVATVMRWKSWQGWGEFWLFSCSLIFRVFSHCGLWKDIFTGILLKFQFTLHCQICISLVERKNN